MSWTKGTQMECLGSSSAVGSAYANSVTNTAVSPVSGAAKLPADFFPVDTGIGKRIWVKAFGVLSTTGTPTLNIGLSANTTEGTYNASGILASTGSTAQAATVTNVPWELDLMIACSATGGSGTFLSMGKALIYTASTTVQSMRFASSGANPNTAATLSTFTAYYLELFALWGTQSASNSLTVYDYSVYGVN